MWISIPGEVRNSRFSLATREESGSTILPTITETKLAEDHRLSIGLPCLGELTPGLVIRAEAKIFSPKLPVENTFTNSLIDFRIVIANVL
jgi:hypothetical protein